MVGSLKEQMGVVMERMSEFEDKLFQFEMGCHFKKYSSPSH